MAAGKTKSVIALDLGASNNRTRAQNYVNSAERLILAPVTFWCYGLAGSEKITFYFPKDQAAMVGTISEANGITSGITLTEAAPVQTLMAYMPLIIVRDITVADCALLYAVGG